MWWRRSNLKSFKSRKIKKPFFKKTLVFLGAILIIFGLYKFLTGFFLIKTIKITADQKAALKGVEKLAGQNLLFLNRNKWEKEIEKENPVLKDIKIEKKFPFQVLITFKKREPKASIFNSTSNIAFLIDGEGVILEQQKEEKGVPVIIASLQNFKIGDRIKNKNIDLVLNLISVVEEYTQSSKFEIDEIARILKVTLSGDVLVLISLEKEQESIIYSLQLLLKKFKIEGNWPRKIDLRFEKPILSF